MFWAAQSHCQRETLLTLLAVMHMHTYTSVRAVVIDAGARGFWVWSSEQETR